MRGLPEASEPRQGYDAAAAGIGPGVLGPTMLVLEGQGIAQRGAELASFQTELEGDRQIVGVLGPADQPLPSRAGVMLAPNGNAARYVLALDGDPDGASCHRRAQRARRRAAEHARAQRPAGRPDRDHRRHDDRLRTERRHDHRLRAGRAGRPRGPAAPALVSAAELGRAAVPGRQQPARRSRRARHHGLRLPGPARLRRAGLLRAGRERDPPPRPGRRLQRLPDQPHLAARQRTRSCAQRSAPPESAPAARSPWPASSSPSPSPPWP